MGKSKTMQEYISYYLAQRLNQRLYRLEDLAQEINLFLCTSEQLRPYLEENIVPAGKDLSFLKAVMCRQRLKFINKENEIKYGRRNADTMKVMEILQAHRFKDHA